jgi:hypothetical protein
MSIYRQYCPETGFYFDYDTNGHICLGISKTYYCKLCKENKFEVRSTGCEDCRKAQRLLEKEEAVKRATALDELYPPEPYKPSVDLRDHARILNDPH